MTRAGWKSRAIALDAENVALRQQLELMATWVRSALDCEAFVWSVDQWNAADDSWRETMEMLKRPVPAKQTADELVVTVG